jgi:hypothetical protein
MLWKYGVPPINNGIHFAENPHKTFLQRAYEYISVALQSSVGPWPLFSVS